MSLVNLASLFTDVQRALQAALCKDSLQLFLGFYHNDIKSQLLLDQTCRECTDVQRVHLSRATAGLVSVSMLFLPDALQHGLSGRHILQTSICCRADASAAKAAGQAAEALLTNPLALQATK